VVGMGSRHMRRGAGRLGFRRSLHFKDPAKGRQWPDNLIIITNVDVTAGKNGTLEKARKVVAAARPALRKRFHVWGGTKVVDLLDQNQAVAKRYGHFLTPGHVLEQLYSALTDDRVNVNQLVTALVVQGIRDQRRMRIEQAGSPEDQPPGIDELFVDLPYIDPGCKTRGEAAVTLFKAASECHRPTGGAVVDKAWRRWRTAPCRAPVWFVRAGPGRGKSTIGQFFCQVQRAALVMQDPTLSGRANIEGIAANVKAAADQLGIWPRTPRVPIWVELRSYSAWYNEQPEMAPKGVLSWLAADLRRSYEQDVPVATIRRALRERSWIIVFDGLDEVPSTIKDAIASEVVRFVEDTSSDADLLTVCTSRPQGYSGQFEALGGAIIELTDLDPKRALECASRVTGIGRTPAEAAQAKGVLEAALRTPAVQEIMTTPLQAHIMAVLVRNGSRPPDRKWDLYDRFYRVIREREANRNLADPKLKALLQGDSRVIDAVHQRLGFILHAKAETAAGAEASLSRTEFRRLVEDVIRRFGTSGPPQDMVDVVTEAATDRLVLINTPDNGSHVRFDVRAIQEFFAAEFLYEDVEVKDLRTRLEVVASDSHWLEVVQFLLGALVSTRRRTERTVAFDVLRWIDQGGDAPDERPLARQQGVGARHALALLSNGVVETDQQVRMQLRDILDPEVASLDTEFLRSVVGGQGEQTHRWLWDWAKEQVRTRSGGGAMGAMRVLARLSRRPGTSSAEINAIIESAPTQLLDEFVSVLAQAPYHVLAHAPYDDEGDVPDWQESVFAALFGREDILRNAPRMVWTAISESTDRDLGRRFRDHSPLFEDAAGLKDIFSVPVERKYGPIVFREAQLQDGAGPRLQAAASDDEARPLLRWLGRLFVASRTPTVAAARELLEELGSNWHLVSMLPEELLRGLPIPIAIGAILPFEFAKKLGPLTDDEYRLGLAAGKLVGVPLRRGWKQPHRMNPTADPIDLPQLHSDCPEVIVQLATALSGESTWRSDDLVAEAKKLIVSVPEYAQGTSAGALFSLLSDPSPALWDAFRTVGRTTRLHHGWSWQPLPHLRLDPSGSDRHLLVLAANALLGQFARSMDSRFGRPGGDGRLSVREWVEASVPTFSALRELTAEPADDDVSVVAAILLAALHPAGGLSVLLDRVDTLRAAAARGVAVATSCALVIEALGEVASPAARGLEASLIEATSDTSDNKHGDMLWASLQRWRERSRAPVTSGHHLERWLA
jgi:hypothetical protein